MISHGKDIKVFSGNANPKLAEEICKLMGTKLGEAEVGTFSDGDKDTYKDLVNDWLNKDYFMTLADFRAYMDIQAQIEETYRDPMKWSRMAVLNVANSGYFSSDRSIEDYLERIWHTGPLK